MQGHTSQRGAALILLLGIMATLAILAATLVFVIMNQQRATATTRSEKQSFYAAEGALDTGVRLAKVDKIMSTTAEWLTPTELDAAFAGAGFPAGATVTYRVYDNLATVDYDIKWDQGGPTSPTTPDQMVWVEVTVVYKGETSRARVLVSQTAKPFSEALPKAVTYSDTGITLNDSSDIYAVNADGSPDTSGPPYVSSITAGGTWIQAMPASYAEVGRFTTQNTSIDLAAPGTSTQSLGIIANGSVSVAGSVFNSAPTGSVSTGSRTFDQVTIQPGVVGYLSDYFDQKAQSELANESQEAYPVRANAAGILVAPSKFTTSTTTGITTIPGVTRVGSSAPYTYTFANDVVLTGNLTLQSGTGTGAGVFPAGTTFQFASLLGSLYTNYSLTLSGQLTLKTKALYVGQNFTITGPSSSSQAVRHWLGSVFVKATPADATYGGNVNWSGYASVTSRDYSQQADPDADSAQPLPMWMGRYWKRSGTYNDEYGKVWVPGNSSISTVFQSTGASTVLCPLLCTTEKPTFTGSVTFGTPTQPMVFFYMCDNNGIYPMTCQFGVPSGDTWGQTAAPYTGTFNGLLVINEAPIVIIDDSNTTPSVRGAIFAGCPYDPTYTTTLSKSDITLRNFASVAYDKEVVGAIATSSLKTTILVTQTVPGSWQQLPVN